MSEQERSKFRLEYLPLSEHALSELRNIARKPLTCLEVNPGVRERLSREGLVEIVQLPSPYKKHKGANCSHLQITEKGRGYL